MEYFQSISSVVRFRSNELVIESDGVENMIRILRCGKYKFIRLKKESLIMILPNYHLNLGGIARPSTNKEIYDLPIVLEKFLV